MQPQTSSTHRRASSGTGGSKRLRASKTFLHPDQCGLDGLAPELPSKPAPVEVDTELEEITAGLDPEQRARVIQYLDSTLAEDSKPWSIEEIVDLHMILLEDLQRIANPRTPIGEAIEILCWVFTDPLNPGAEEAPFSLKNCLKVVNGFSYRDSMADPKMGQFNVTSFREAFRRELKPWWKALVSRQSKIVRDILTNDLDFFVKKVLANPQWANEQLKKLKDRSDMTCNPLVDGVVWESISGAAKYSVSNLVHDIQEADMRSRE